MITKRTLLLVYMVFILSLGLSSCNTFIQTEKEQQFRQMYPDIAMNRSLRSIVLETALIDRKSIIVANHSNDMIRIQGRAAHGLYIYNEVDRKWVLLEETLNYINDQEIILYPKKDINFPAGQLNTVDISILPDLENIKEPVSVRVVVIGESLKQGQPVGKKEGSYVDVTYQPKANGLTP